MTDEMMTHSILYQIIGTAVQVDIIYLYYNKNEYKMIKKYLNIDIFKIIIHYKCINNKRIIRFD